MAGDGFLSGPVFEQLKHLLRPVIVLQGIYLETADVPSGDDIGARVRQRRRDNDKRRTVLAY